MSKQVKYTATVLCIIFCLILTSCGGNKREPSEKAASVGKQALTAVDAYLDGDMSYDEAYEKLNDLSDELDYVKDQDIKDEHHIEDSTIQICISGISIRLMGDNYDSDSESYKELLNKRNDLAEKLGEEKR